VKRSAYLGDRPFIDTLESGIQLQNRKIGLLEEELNLKNKSQYLEVFLWKEGFVPLELDSLTRPSERRNLGAALMDLQVYDQLDSLISFHPALMYGQNKIDMKSVDLKLKRQGILPNVDMKYNLLSEPLGLDQLNQVSSSNYNWGLTVNYPLFTRKERGSIQLTQIQLEQDQMDLLTKRELVEYKVKMAINSYQTSNLQIDQYQQVTNDYERLLDAEKQLFSIGESSLFMINSREKAFIDAQLKLVDYQFENQLSKQRVYYELVTIP
jgi:outer membrane protein TolC